MAVDILAIAAHRDDVELTCGGALIKAIDDGYRAGILDLTAGETATRGSASLRAEEAARAASVMGVHERRNAGFPDAHLANTEETRKLVIEQIRHFAPRVVILPFSVGRHPDHRITAELVTDASFLAGLARFPAVGTPHRPFKLVYATAFREDADPPTFVIDVSAQMERKLEAIAAFTTQFAGKSGVGEVFPGGDRPILEQVRAACARYGSLVRVAYGEPFRTRETVLQESLGTLAVSTF